ncbi:MAG: arginine--tRNA ligase [Candidatus Saccharibacteria bacterium]
MKKQIKQLVFGAIKELGINPQADELSRITIERPEPELADYSTNAALILAKTAGKKPRELAEAIASKIASGSIGKTEVAGPGFINFRLSDERLLRSVREIAARGIGKPKVAGEKILVEYFQPNIAKPMHIGLLRTTIIGDALKRMLMFLGNTVESDTHMGDWGTQFGLLLLAYKKYGDGAVIEKDPVNELNKIYVKINQEAEADSAVREAGKAEFAKLEQGDKDNRAIWQKFVDMSMEKFLLINEWMDILAFEHHWPESYYENLMPAIVEKLQSLNLLKESQGAKIVDLENQSLGVAVVIKSDGSTTYLLRDLATFVYRKSLGFSRQLYVVDSRQSHAFRQLFAILKLMGEMKDEEGVHVDYGFISFEGSALSTRKGNMVLVEDVLRQAQEKAAAVIEEKNPELKNKQEVVKAVAIGALKYFDLSHNRHSDIDFDWNTALSFDGNSGPYLQYTYARLKSILRKAGDEAASQAPDAELDPAGRQVLVLLENFADTVEESLSGYMPNLFANYLYELSEALNKFYHSSPVLTAEGDLKKLRLSIVAAGANALAEGLKLLGITPLEEM